MTPYIWLGILILFVVIEGATMSLTTVWFALGALCASILSCLPGVPEFIQFLAFVTVSGLSLWLLRPIARRYMSSKKVATNADRVISQIGVVIEEIDNLRNTGAVKVGGKIWTARAYTGEPIALDVRVRVLFIEGVKIIVEPAAVAVSNEQLTN